MHFLHSCIMIWDFQCLNYLIKSFYKDKLIITVAQSEIYMIRWIQNQCIIMTLTVTGYFYTLRTHRFIFLYNKTGFQTFFFWVTIQTCSTKCWTKTTSVLMFSNNIPHQCLLSDDKSQAISLVGPHISLDRFITTKTPGQSQVIHQGPDPIQQCQVEAK